MSGATSVVELLVAGLGASASIVSVAVGGWATVRSRREVARAREQVRAAQEAEARAVRRDEWVRNRLYRLGLVMDVAQGFDAARSQSTLSARPELVPHATAAAHALRTLPPRDLPLHRWELFPDTRPLRPLLDTHARTLIAHGDFESALLAEVVEAMQMLGRNQEPRLPHWLAAELEAA